MTNCELDLSSTSFRSPSSWRWPGEAGEVERVGAREGKIGDPHSTYAIYHQKLSYNTNLKPIPTQLSTYYNLTIMSNSLRSVDEEDHSLERRSPRGWGGGKGWGKRR